MPPLKYCVLFSRGIGLDVYRFFFKVEESTINQTRLTSTVFKEASFCHPPNPTKTKKEVMLIFMLSRY